MLHLYCGFLENDLPFAVYGYDFFFKSNMSDEYMHTLCYLSMLSILRQRKNYDRATIKRISDLLYYMNDHTSLFNVIFKKLLAAIDEDTIEGGFNSKITKIVRDIADSLTAIKEVKYRFVKS